MPSYVLSGYRLGPFGRVETTLSITTEAEVPLLEWSAAGDFSAGQTAPNGLPQVEFSISGFEERDVRVDGRPLTGLEFDHDFAGALTSRFGEAEVIGFISGTRQAVDGNGEPLFDDTGWPLWEYEDDYTEWVFQIGGEPLPDLTRARVFRQFVNSLRGEGEIAGEDLLDLAAPSPFVEADGEPLRYFGEYEGTDGPDHLFGDYRPNLMRGYGGNDTLYGGGGEDHIDGGTGADNLVGNRGGDRIYGGSGGDSLTGGGGGDRIYGGAGRDTLIGGKGNDLLDAGGGWASVVGNQGADRIVASQFKGRIQGSGGDDSISVRTGGDGHSGQRKLYGNGGDDLIRARGEGDVQIYGGRGPDELRGGLGDDRITAGHGDDRAYGGQGDDLIRMGPGDNFVFGGAGDDILRGGHGDDVMVGGRGSDVFDPAGGRNEIRDYDIGIDALMLGRLAAVQNADQLDAATSVGRNGLRITEDDRTILLRGIFDEERFLADAQLIVDIGTGQ